MSVALAMSSTSPSKLVAGLRACDERAFSDAYALFGDRLYSFGLRLSGRHDMADELFQHAWLTLAERAPKLPPDINLLAWLLTVARNHWRSHYRKARTHDRNEGALRRHQATAQRPDVSLEQRTRLAQIESALARLSEHHREVLVLMVEADDVPQYELASVLGVAPDVFRKRLSRARAALTTLLNCEEEQR